MKCQDRILFRGELHSIITTGDRRVPDRLRRQFLIHFYLRSLHHRQPPAALIDLIILTAVVVRASVRKLHRFVLIFISLIIIYITRDSVLFHLDLPLLPQLRPLPQKPVPHRHRKDRHPSPFKDPFRRRDPLHSILRPSITYYLSRILTRNRFGLRWSLSQPQSYS